MAKRNFMQFECSNDMLDFMTKLSQIDCHAVEIWLRVVVRLRLGGGRLVLKSMVSECLGKHVSKKLVLRILTESGYFDVDEQQNTLSFSELGMADFGKKERSKNVGEEGSDETENRVDSSSDTSLPREIFLTDTPLPRENSLTDTPLPRENSLTVNAPNAPARNSNSNNNSNNLKTKKNVKEILPEASGGQCQDPEIRDEEGEGEEATAVTGEGEEAVSHDEIMTAMQAELEKEKAMMVQRRREAEVRDHYYYLSQLRDQNYSPSPQLLAVVPDKVRQMSDQYWFPYVCSLYDELGVQSWLESLEMQSVDRKMIELAKRHWNYTVTSFVEHAFCYGILDKVRSCTAARIRMAFYLRTTKKPGRILKSRLQWLELSQAATDVREKTYYRTFEKSYPHLMEMEVPLTYKQFDYLDKTYGRRAVLDALKDMENSSDLKTRSVPLTLKKWLEARSSSTAARFK